MTRAVACATLILLVACSHQTLPGEGTGGTAAGGNAGSGAGAGGSGGTGPGGSAGATAGTGGTAGMGGSGACNTPNPSEACRTSPSACLPSSCKCSAGSWACTKDCGGGRVCNSADAGAANCPPTCFRAVRCVNACGGPPVSHGCCSCVPPAFDDISCPKAGAFESFLYTSGSGPCPPNSDCSSFTELLALGLLRHDCSGQLPVVVHETMIPAVDRDAVIAVLTDPALVALLDQSGPPCQPPTDVFESMTLVAGGKIHKNAVTFCKQPPIETARSALNKLVQRYLISRCPMR
jgi:hypothetical protein